MLEGDWTDDFTTVLDEVSLLLIPEILTCTAT